MKHILKCVKCGKYTLKNICLCGGKAVRKKPAKFSVSDNYADYRRRALEKERKERGLIK